MTRRSRRIALLVACVAVVIALPARHVLGLDGDHATSAQVFMEHAGKASGHKKHHKKHHHAAALVMKSHHQDVNTHGHGAR